MRSLSRSRRPLIALLVLVLLWLTTTSAGALPEADRAVVRTDAGPVRGTETADHLVFQGIPYAAPPVGPLRWESPRPVQPWSRPRDATKPASVCPQPAGHGQPASLNEDCLYLDVTSPRRPGRPRPVMVWVHGGGFVSGAGTWYDARRLATAADAVVVTINYRLGIFGYFGYPGLEASGGFGIQDQQAALRWVRRNAAAFGGDPRNVTLFGESAGGLSTCAQLTAPGAAGLFDKAIMQSGSCMMDYPDDGLIPGVPAGTFFGPVQEPQAMGLEVAKELGCVDAPLACLRSRVTTEALLKVTLAPAFSRPSYGNSVLPRHPAEALRAGRFHRVPVISGTTRDEGRSFSAAFWGQVSEADYRAMLEKSFPGKAALVEQQYPLSDHGVPGDPWRATVAWGAVTTDRVWSCPTLVGDRLLAERVPTYAFDFADRQAPRILDLPAGFPAGAYHGSEVAYLFTFPGVTFTPEQRRLSDQLMRYWGRFAHTGSPNGPGLPDWPRVRAGAPAPPAQSLAPGAVRPVDLGAEHRCGFWAGLG